MSREQDRVPASADLRAFRFFDGLDDRGLEAVAALARFERVPAGSLLLREGEPADVVRVLREGRVSVSISVPGQPETVVYTLSRGQLLGFLALLTGRRWSASARALKPCSLIVLPADSLVHLCETDHGVGFHLMRNALRSAADQLHDSRLQLLDIFGQPSKGSA